MGRRQFRRAEQRARAERMMVRPVAECEYTVENLTKGTSYRVRFLSINGKPFGNCDCLAGRPARGDEVPMICKHLWSAAVVHVALARMDSRAMGRSTRIN
jgi:hypothetical protein